MPRLTTNVVASDEFTRANTTNTLGTADLGGTWKNVSTIGIASNGAVKTSGAGTARGFALLAAGVTGDVTVDAWLKTNPAANLTDAGIAIRALDSWATRGGQLYVSVRKTATANSVRLLQRANTSGSDTVLVQNTAAGWVDGTDYLIRVAIVGKTIDVLRKLAANPGDPYVSVLPGGTPYTISDAVLATLGTDVGISFTNTDTGSRFEDFYVIDPNYTPPAPTATTMLPIAHRGTPGSAPDSTEESAAGRLLLDAKTRGVEVDARLPSDYATTGAVFLCHDGAPDGLLRVFGATGSVEDHTAAQLRTIGVPELGPYLEGCANDPRLVDVLVQHYTANTVAQLTPIINIIKASRVAHIVTVMTSASAGATPGFAAIRGAGWTGRLACYGMDGTTWPTYSSAFATYGVACGFTPPGDSAYTANRATIAAMIAAGYQAGASTVDTLPVMDQAHADGCHYLLTNEVATFAGKYDPPAPRTVLPWTLGPSTAVELLGVYNGTAIVPAEVLTVT